MTTTVINLKGRIHDYGPQLQHAPASLVYVGRQMTGVRAGGWDLPAHLLQNPPENSLKRLGTPEAAVAAYIQHLLNRPDFLDQAAALHGKTLACWCAPDLCHAHAIAWWADGITREQLAQRADDLEAAAGRAETYLFDRVTT